MPPVSPRVLRGSELLWRRDRWYRFTGVSPGLSRPPLVPPHIDALLGASESVASGRPEPGFDVYRVTS
jgi:hypothetical protein